MRWEFSSAATRGLHVIPEIPDITPCLLEGRNGIGKTVAIQLLQLASGVVPVEFVARPELWTSLRERLGSTVVRGTRLLGASEVLIEFTPELWPEFPQVDASLARVQIDGVESPLAEVANLVDVQRISGNEDLSLSVERHLDRLEGQLGRVGRRIRERGSTVRAAVADLLPDLQRIDPSLLPSLAQDIATSSRKLAESEALATSTAERLRDIQHARETIRRRDALDEAAEALLEKRAAAAAAVDEQERLLKSAQMRASDLSSKMASEGGIGEKFADASKRVRDRATRKARLDQAVASSAGGLGVDPTIGAATAALESVRDEIERANLELARLDASGQVKGALEVIAPALNSLPASLNDFVLADGFTPELTVAATKVGVAARREAISKEPTPEQVRSLMDGLQVATKREDALESLLRQIGLLVSAERLLAESQDEYDLLASQSEGASITAREAREANQEVGRLQMSTALAHQELAEVSSRLSAQGTLSREDADNEIQGVLARLSLGVDKLEPAEAETARQLAELDRAVVDAQERLATEQRRLIVARSEVDEVATRLDRLPWLKAIVADHKLRGADGLVDAHGFEAIRLAIMSAVQSINDVEEVVERLQGLARAYAQHRGDDGYRILDDQSREMVEPFTQMLSERILAALNSPAIQSRVFDGAQAVQLDPVRRTLTLQAADKSQEQRPISSFSTGQQAFAFTQARILDLIPANVPNRLLVLDEFGAFVSADRLPDLAEFLRSHEVDQIATQVVVVLPLQVNYEQEIADTKGDLRAEYERRLAQIADRDYFAMELA